MFGVVRFVPEELSLCSNCGGFCDDLVAHADFGILDELRGRLWTADRLVDAMDELPTDHYADVPYPLL
ncbi:MAG: hypothetical protein M3Q60_07360 [Actinomycetota bacterium]|nr:hypothetical protein [Actinomycetota bacterium]